VVRGEQPVKDKAQYDAEAGKAEENAGYRLKRQFSYQQRKQEIELFFYL
jgi:hypothetical protein